VNVINENALRMRQSRPGGPAQRARAREWGAVLRGLLTEADLTMREAAVQMDRNQAQISRWCTGDRSPSEADLAVFLHVCGVPHKRRVELLATIRHELLDPARFVRTGPQRLDSLAFHSSTATQVWEIGLTALPRPLRTPAYSAFLDPATSEIVPRLAQVEGTSREFVLPELVLRARWGTTRQRAEQWRRLLVVADQAHTDIRVLPDGVPPIPGLSGHFGILQYRQFWPVLFEERGERIEFTDEPDTLAACQTTVDRARSYALDPTTSRTFIRDLLQDPAQASSPRSPQPEARRAG
jgi:transcriptional regulator with XRE-family HTH domain